MIFNPVFQSGGQDASGTQSYKINNSSDPEITIHDVGATVGEVVYVYGYNGIYNQLDTPEFATNINGKTLNLKTSYIGVYEENENFYTYAFIMPPANVSF